jgi:hypothetical protein
MDNVHNLAETYRASGGVPVLLSTERRNGGTAERGPERRNAPLGCEACSATAKRYLLEYDTPAGV